MSESITIQIKRLSDKFFDVELPTYSTDGSSGMDVRAAVEDKVILKPFETKIIPTDFALEIPKGYEAQVRPRSGLASKNFIGILNSPGTIDSDYRGEIKIILSNFGKEDFIVSRGDRIAQLVISKVERADLKLVDDLGNSTRNSGGFGHTGVK